MAAPATTTKRGLQQPSGTWNPARIKVLYQGLASSGITSSESRVIQEFAVPRAIDRLSGAFRVRQSQAALQLSRTCTFVWTNTGGKCSAEPEPPVCGFPSLGITASIPASIVGPAVYYPDGPNSPAATVPAGGPGLERTDFVVFATAASSTSAACGGDTQAFATVCQRDSSGRPVSGIIVFCSRFLQSSGSALAALDSAPASEAAELAAMLEFQLGRMVDLTVHELMHAMGFSSDSWPLFVSDATGSPLTPRDADGNPANARSVSCQGSTFTTFYADSSTVAFYSERGAQQCDPATLNSPSECVSRVVLPHSQLAARELFGCQDLEGVEIENQPTTDCALSGSHLEQRVFSGTVMTAYTTQASLLDAASLAVLHDSGWWLPNYFAGGDMQPGRDFATHAGCQLARDSRCLAQGNPPTQGPTAVTRSATGASEGSLSPSRFCTAAADRVCTPDLRAIALCSFTTYTTPVPELYRYFTDNSAMGGDPQPDFCPQAGFYSNQICGDPAANWDGGVVSNGEATVRAVFGNVFGAGSMCLASRSLIKAGWQSSSPPAVGCFRVSCGDRASGLVHIAVDSQQGNGLTTVTCSAKGAAVAVPGYSGSLLCPDPVLVCGDAAPVVPEEPGSVGIGSSMIQVPWPRDGSSSPAASATTLLSLARALHSTAGQSASALPAVEAIVTLRAATASELALAGVADAVAGQPAQDLGFAQQGNATSSSSTASVSWQAGETGRKTASAAWVFPAWPVDINDPTAEPAARVLIASLTGAAGSETAISSESNSAVVVLTTSASTAIIPPPSTSAALAAASAIVVAFVAGLVTAQIRGT